MKVYLQIIFLTDQSLENRYQEIVQIITSQKICNLIIWIFQIITVRFKTKEFYIESATVLTNVGFNCLPDELFKIT